MAENKTTGRRTNTQQAAARVHPWERRPDESPQAYAAFRAHLECGPERTLQQAADKIRKSRHLLAAWSRRHGWQERAFAWDQHHYREEEAAVRAARQEVLKRQAQDADRLQRLAMARLGKLVQRNRQTGDLELDSDVSVQDAVRIYRLGMEIERSLPGSAEQPLGQEVDEDELRQMTDRELRELITLARARMDRETKEDNDDGNEVAEA